MDRLMIRTLAFLLPVFLALVTGARADEIHLKNGGKITGKVTDLGDRVKITPLATWSRTDVWRFITEHDVPYNPLHDQGYHSVGDAPLTTPVRSGEDERAGRWRGTTRTECGIHALT